MGLIFFFWEILKDNGSELPDYSLNNTFPFGIFTRKNCQEFLMHILKNFRMASNRYLTHDNHKQYCAQRKNSTQDKYNATSEMWHNVKHKRSVTDFWEGHLMVKHGKAKAKTIILGSFPSHSHYLKLLALLVSCASTSWNFRLWVQSREARKRDGER